MVRIFSPSWLQHGPRCWSVRSPSNPQRVYGALMIPPLGQFWTVANMLSLFRVVLAIPITYLILVDGWVGWILGLILLAGLTDWFDGKVARLSHTVSNWGKVLDPLSDKAAMLMVSVALVIRGDLPIWFVGIIMVREVLTVLGSVLLTRRISEVKMSTWSGKVAITAMAVTVLAALLKADAPILQFCIWLTLALMLYSFALYLLRYLKLWRTAPAPAESEADGDSGPTVASLKQQTS